VGENGAGHFVKMVHNGIEYGDMQIIAEAYHLMREGLGMSNDEMSAVFGRWNEGKLQSYLIEITRDVLAYRDETGQAVVDLILDSAGQKGTGKWTVSSALDMGIPLTLIGEAVFGRNLSALKEERVAASHVLDGPSSQFEGDKAAFSQRDGTLSQRDGTLSQRDGTLSQRDGTLLADLEDAVYASKIASYAQGYMLMRSAAAEYKWNLNYGGIALMWRGGCIIRSAFLGKIKEAFDADSYLSNLLLAPYFREAVTAAQGAWRRVVATAIELGIPAPAMSSALAFYDGYRRGWLPANLIQAQRDYFGAHTYERVDRPRGQCFHTDWTGQGGDVTAGTYLA
jgi:6-phosphogluconate dehydrogenase